MTKAFNYQKQREQLDAILADLQDETLDVDEALKKYETGLTLIKELESYLESAEHTITKIKAKFE